MKKLSIIFAFSLILAACFSPWLPDEALITLYIGGGSGRAAISNEVLNKLDHTIVLTGPTGERTLDHSGAETVTVNVAPGYWNITITASLDGKPYAVGSGGREVIAGQSNPVTIDMAVYPEFLPIENRWFTWAETGSRAAITHSVNEDVCEITVSGTAEPNVPGNYRRYYTNASFAYTAKTNTAYEYVFEAWTAEGQRYINVQYYWDEDVGPLSKPEMMINSERKTYTVRGKSMPVGGVRNLEFQCADQLGTFYVKMLSITESEPLGEFPESWPVEERWSVYSNSPAAIDDYSAAPDGTFAITVGRVGGDIWDAAASYAYTGKANTAYKYVFEAWTMSSGRNIRVQYYWDDDTDVSLFEDLPITNTPTSYTIIGKTLQKGGIRNLDFQCADQTGTFYVKVTSITESGGSEPSGNTLSEKLNWLQDNAQDGGNYVLEVTADESTQPQTLSYNGKTVAITLKGDSANRAVSLSSNGSMFTVGNGVTLALDNNITLKGHSSNTVSLVSINSGGTLIMNEGSFITGNTSHSNGGGVSVGDGATFTMNGGEISGNTIPYNMGTGRGGGVSVSGGTFTMNGGKISGNGNTPYTGGGVEVASGTFIMTGGEISGNNAQYGGGVYVEGGSDSSGIFIMNGGKIYGNTASREDNSTSGGGVHVNWGATFTMSSGEIYGNTAASGGGVSVGSSSFNNASTTFTMTGGEIYGNIAAASGGGVYATGTFRIVTGTIYGLNEGDLSNTAAEDCGAALDGTAQLGTFNGTAWNGSGDLTKTDDTIRVVNGVLQTASPELAFTLINNETAYSVGAGTVTSGEVVIPADYNGLPVTEIGAQAFDNSDITRVSIPATVTTIHNKAFYFCQSLTRVTFAENSQLKTIGNEAFWFCRELTSVTIPEGVTSIGHMAFYGCSSLAEINIPAGVTVISGQTFQGCTSLTAIYIPAAVTTIDQSAFHGCTGIAEIIIPATVMSVRDDAFSGWTPSQTIYVKGHADQAAADAAWSEIQYNYWRHNCNATIIYEGSQSGAAITIRLWEDEAGYIHVSNDSFEIFRSGTPDSFTASIDNGSNRYNGVEWLVRGESVLKNEYAITISAENYTAGTYQLVAVVYKDNVPYSAEIIFVVKN